MTPIEINLANPDLEIKETHRTFIFLAEVSLLDKKIESLLYKIFGASSCSSFLCRNTLSGLFLVSTAPTAPPSDLPNTTILDVSMSVL